MPDPLDCLIIGAGAAGLTAAIDLGRFRRRFEVLESGDSRLGWIPRTHNHPGFPDGVPGRDLQARMRAQAERYGAIILRGKVRTLDAVEGGFTAAIEDGDQVRARTVILATGVKDAAPALPEVFDAVQRGLIRICPICDGFEASGQAIGVIGAGEKGANEALFLRTWSDRVTLIHVAELSTLPAKDRARLAQAGIEVIETAIDQVRIEEERILALGFGAAGVRDFDTVYSALGSTPRSRLAETLGAETDDCGCLKVTDHQETTVPGLYAAGDVVRGLNQISVACGEGAIAAVAVHNRLRAGEGAV